MPKLESISPEGRFMGLFVGKSGSGKTSAEATFPKPIKILDFDGRVRGILGCEWIDISGIDYEYYPPKSKIGESTVTKLNKDLETLELICRTQPANAPKTLILDSLTSQTFAMLCEALPLTHKNRDGDKGKKIGALQMPGPEDYGFEAQGTYQMLSFLRSLPIPNIIVSAHLVPIYGKEDPNNPYSEKIVIGEKLSIRDKIAENSMIYFDHVFRFEKILNGQTPKHYVKFHSDLARTTFKNMPFGNVDITKKNFYETMIQLSKG